MLDELKLPRLTSEIDVNTDNTVIVTVMFFASAQSVHQINGQYSCESNPQNSIRDAENEAVHEAIQYMECVERKTPKDYSYAKLQRKQEYATSLLQMDQKDQDFKQLAKYCDTFIDGVHAASEKIAKIIQQNLCEPKNNEEHKIGSVFLKLLKVTFNLKQLIPRSTELFQAIGKYTYQEETHFSKDKKLNDYCGVGLKYRGGRSYNDELIYDTEE